MKDLASLLKALDPDAGLAQRHVWLIKLFEWIRGDQTSAAAAVARVQAFIEAVEMQPELRTRLQAWWQTLIQTVDITTLLADFGFAPRTERRDVQGCQAVGGRQRVDCKQALRRPIETGRMIQCGASRKTGRHGAGGRRRRSEAAEAVENARRRQHLPRGTSSRRAGLGCRCRCGEGDDSLEHFHECA